MALIQLTHPCQANITIKVEVTRLQQIRTLSPNSARNPRADSSQTPTDNSSCDENLAEFSFSHLQRMIQPDVSESDSGSIENPGLEVSQERDTNREPPNNKPGFIQKLKQLFSKVEGESPLKVVRRLTGQTAVVVTAQLLGISALAVCLKPLGVTLGNSGAAELNAMAKSAPLTFVALACVVAPIIEEFIFRYIPSKVVDFVDTLRSRDTTQNPALGTGILAATIFAAAHGLSALPIPQFLSGLFFWRSMRNYGYTGAVFCHAMQNSLLIGLGYLLARGF